MTTPLAERRGSDAPADRRARIGLRYATLGQHFRDLHACTGRGGSHGYEDDRTPRGKKADAPVPVRVDVLDGIRDLRDTLLTALDTVRATHGFTRIRYTESATYTRMLVRGMDSPDPKVLHAAEWLSLTLPVCWPDLLDGYREFLWADGGRLIRQSRHLLGLADHRRLRPVADCHLCGVPSCVAVDPYNSDRALCIACRNQWRRSEGEWFFLGGGIPAQTPMEAVTDAHAPAGV